MSRPLMTVVGVVCLSCLGNLLAQTSEKGVTVTTSLRVHPVLIRNETNALLQIVVEVQRDDEV